MGRLIEADALKASLGNGRIVIDEEILECGNIHDILMYLLEKVEAVVMEKIDERPTVEAVTVVHGRWVFNPRIGEHECSNCKGSISLSDDTASHPRYCPQCGAKMDKGE